MLVGAAGRTVIRRRHAHRELVLVAAGSAAHLAHGTLDVDVGALGNRALEVLHQLASKEHLVEHAQRTDGNPRAHDLNDACLRARLNDVERQVVRNLPLQHGRASLFPLACLNR